MADDEFAEKVRRQIWDAYGLDEMTPDERAAFDTYGRIMEALRTEEHMFIQAVQADANRFAETLLAGTGLTFTFETDPDDRLPRSRNPHIGCYEHASGTWIHGRPHDCPRWLTP